VQVEEACTTAEIDAARRSEPSPEAERILGRAEQRGIPVAIVSNNSEMAVRTFLDRFGWTTRIAGFACRHPHDAALMKPHPHLVANALLIVGAEPHDAVLVGDSVSDVTAGHRAGVRVIGLAKNPRRGEELRRAGADAIMRRE
jgi:HAD superfamily hydrolase (TIGR01509 family)